MSPSTVFVPPHVIHPAQRHTHTIILLHGRGSSGEEFAEEFFEGRTSQNSTLLELASGKTCKWIFPNAPSRMSTVFQEELTEWFDIYSLTNPDEREELQLDGLRESIAHVHEIISEELERMAAHKIILGGISQGFAVAVHALLSGPHRLGGFLGFCGWMPLRRQLSRFSLDAQETRMLDEFYFRELDISKPVQVKETTIGSPGLRTPAFVCHSEDDSTIDVKLGRQACHIMRALGMQVRYEEYPDGEHWIQEPRGYNSIQAQIVSILEQ